MISQAALTALQALPAHSSSLINTKPVVLFHLYQASQHLSILSLSQFANLLSIIRFQLLFVTPTLSTIFIKIEIRISTKSPRSPKNHHKKIVQPLPDFRAAASRHPCSGFPMLAQPLPDKNLITSYHSVTNLNTLKRPFFAHRRPILP